MAKILVTGGAGYLGSELMHSLHELGFDAMGLSRRQLPGLVTCDLLDLGSLYRAIAETTPDRIVHAAAQVPQKLSEYNDSESAQQSLHMIENLLAATLSSRTPLIYISSMTVYGCKGDIIRREEDAGHPESNYGIGKWQGEQLIHASGRDAIAVRIPGLFGGQRTDGLVCNTVQAFRSGTNPVLPAQSMVWAAMHVRDAAQSIARIVGASFSGFLPVNFGYSDTYSISRLVELVSSLFERSHNYDQPQPDFKFDLSRARALGVTTDVSLREALVRLMKEFR